MPKKKHVSTSTRVQCNLCKARVLDTLQKRWEHVARHHADVLAARILPILETAGQGVYRLGEMFGDQLVMNLKKSKGA